MNEAYWKTYYENHERLVPSSFAEWARPLIRGEFVVDMGCGDGRDTNHLRASMPGVGVDPNAPDGEQYIRQNWFEWIEDNPPSGDDTLYMRWFAHAIPFYELYELISRWEGQVLIEARLAGLRGDAVDDTHKRWPVNSSHLMIGMLTKGYEIRHYEEGYFSEPDSPLLFRLDAQK